MENFPHTLERNSLVSGTKLKSVKIPCTNKFVLRARLIYDKFAKSNYKKLQSALGGIDFNALMQISAQPYPPIPKLYLP